MPTAFLPPFNLESFLQDISDRMNLTGNVTIKRASETAKLNAIQSSELKDAAEKFGLRVVRRMGGTQFEFTRRPLFHFPYGTLQYPH